MQEKITTKESTQRSVNPVLVVDSYAQGISIGKLDRNGNGLQLRIDGEQRDSAMMLRSRYVMKSGAPLVDLERHLSRLSARGELRQTTVVFGVTTDPFHPFDEKFATSMKFLEIFERFSPGRLIVQTRSPLVVIGLPLLRKVRQSTMVSIGIETPCDEVRQRYTPDLPTVGERWRTIRALRRLGLKVGVQVSPLLPYGDWRRDAEGFARELCREADFISIRSIVQVAGTPRPNTPMARKLAAERQFFWLRPDSERPLVDAISRIAPEKLLHPAEIAMPDPQLPLFQRA